MYMVNQVAYMTNNEKFQYSTALSADHNTRSSAWQLPAYTKLSLPQQQQQQQQPSSAPLANSNATIVPLSACNSVGLSLSPSPSLTLSPSSSSTSSSSSSVLDFEFIDAQHEHHQQQHLQLQQQLQQQQQQQQQQRCFRDDLDARKDIQLRHLTHGDIDELKTLCAELFPVDYPDSWYNDITSGDRFFSLAAVYHQRIVGLIVAEIKSKHATDKEDWYILSSKHPSNTQITYILSIGVYKQYRRLGIASLLLDTLLSYLKAETDCKAVYLHVLCTNQVAIDFYERRGFQQRIYLPSYYTIKGQLQDGHCYVLYMNDGEPPYTLADCIKHSWTFLSDYNPLRPLVRSLKLLGHYLQTLVFINVTRTSHHFSAKHFNRLS